MRVNSRRPSGDWQMPRSTIFCGWVLVMSWPSNLIEPLTGRELIVLRYLPTLRRNVEIGESMFVTVNTVKAHLKSVYRKLGVSSRREAVEKARELHLL